MNRILLILILLIVMALGAREIYSYQHEYKIAYVEINSLYNSFAFKKELENKLVMIKQTRKNILDSMQLQLRVLASSLNPEKEKDKLLFETTKQTYIEKGKAFSEDNNALTGEYSSSVLKQINEYMQEYGKAHGYSYILGADGNGTIMFADTEKNITDEVLAYLNDRYKGKK
jgi:outer membrane protein